MSQEQLNSRFSGSQFSLAPDSLAYCLSSLRTQVSVILKTQNKNVIFENTSVIFKKGVIPEMKGVIFKIKVLYLGRNCCTQNKGVLSKSKGAATFKIKVLHLKIKVFYLTPSVILKYKCYLHGVSKHTMQHRGHKR